MGNISDQDIDKILDNGGMEMYDVVFTHKSFDTEINYEALEFVGDAIANKSVAYYIFTKFPYLQQPKCVVILNKIKSHLISDKSFSKFGKKLGFWDFISTDGNTRDSQLLSILEDVFEAFMGLTELRVDQVFGRGIGGVICSNIVSKLLDETNIPVRYEDLLDAKTRLKELTDFYNDVKISYKSTFSDKKHHVDIQFRGKVIGSGEEFVLVRAEQIAAKKALRHLARLGYRKKIPRIYREFYNSVH